MSANVLPSQSDDRSAAISEFGELEIDRSAHVVRVKGAPVTLTLREFELLDYFARRFGQLLTRTELLKEVWGPAYDGGFRTVDIHVSRLRRKLGRDLPLVTFRRVGYQFGAATTALTATE